jgi:hypothetical protein
VHAHAHENVLLSISFKVMAEVVIILIGACLKILRSLFWHLGENFRCCIWHRVFADFIYVAFLNCLMNMLVLDFLICNVKQNPGS